MSKLSLRNLEVVSSNLTGSMLFYFPNSWSIGLKVDDITTNGVQTKLQYKFWLLASLCDTESLVCPLLSRN